MNYDFQNTNQKKRKISKIKEKKKENYSFHNVKRKEQEELTCLKKIPLVDKNYITKQIQIFWRQSKNQKRETLEKKQNCVCLRFAL